MVRWGWGGGELLKYLPDSHRSPPNPCGQLQLNPLTKSLYVPLFRQGLLSHSFISLYKEINFILNPYAYTKCGVLFSSGLNFQANTSVVWLKSYTVFAFVAPFTDQTYTKKSKPLLGFFVLM